MKSLLLIFFCAITFPSFSQNFQYKIYYEKDGLSNSSINDVIRDDKGFLWVATQNGLNRFDGNFFDNFNNNGSDSNSIASNEIQRLFIDRKKRLWIGTNVGVSLFHPVTQTFSNYSPDTLVLPVIGITFWGLCDDNAGNLWVGTLNDLLIFNPETKKFKNSGWAKYADQVAPPESNHGRVIIMSILTKSENELWVLSTYGLFSVNTQTFQFRYYHCSLLNDYFQTHLDYFDKRGNLWISTATIGIVSYNFFTDQWSDFPTPVEYHDIGASNSAIKYSGDTLMYCANHSLILFDTKQKKFIANFTYSPGKANSFPNAVYKNVMRQESLLWLGTDKGLVKVTIHKNLLNFHTLSSSYTVNRVYHSSFTGNIILGKDKPGGNLYIKNGNEDEKLIRTSQQEDIHGEYGYFAENGNGYAYLCGNEKFFYYNERTNVAYDIPLPQKRFGELPYDLRNTVIDKNGIVWTRAISQGILQYDPQTKQISFNDDIPIKKGEQLKTLYYDKFSNCLWVNIELEGVLIYDIDRKVVHHYLLNIPPSQKGAGIICITGDGKGNVYLIDDHIGIITYNDTTNKFVRFSVNEGLISNNCMWLTFDSKGYLWISADIGICKMDPATKIFANYYTSEGFPETYQFLSADENGNIYMPLANGYCEWNTANFTENNNNGTIYLRNAQLAGKNIAVRSDYYFSHSENNLKFQFGFLTFENNEPALFEYKLNSGGWMNTGSQASVSFASLSPGSYNLWVRLKNDESKAMIIHFSIKPPYWQTWWFILLMFAILAFVITFFVRRRMVAIRKEASLKHRLVELEMAALRSQMNPHFIFNTLNSINSYIIENKTDEASDYLTEFSQLMRIILEHSKEKLVKLEDDLKALKLYMELESKRLERSFDYRIEINTETDTTDIDIPPLVMQPFVENAIWHGLRNKKGNGFIDIRVEKKNDDLHISISDDGIGREEAKKFQKLKDKSSFGIQATVKRLVLHYPGSSVTIEDLKNEKNEPCGTRVDIFFKIKKTSHVRENY
jgi:ligand-binding sensor domain-containing protein/two-component sensor histidine kinase